MAYEPVALACGGHPPLPVRHFHIPTGPSVADPAWTIAVWEVPHGAPKPPEGVIGEHVEHVGFEELKRFIHDREIKRAQMMAVMEEQDRICKMFCVKHIFELEAKAKELSESK